MKRLLPHFVKYAESCYLIWLNMHSRKATGTSRLINMQSRSSEATVAHSQSRSDSYPILLNMQSHSRQATVMPRRRGVDASFIIYPYNRNSDLHLALKL